MSVFTKLRGLLGAEQSLEPVTGGLDTVADLPPAPFIVGSPRSGTSLLRLMLDAHPDLAIPPETGFLRLGATLGGKGLEARQAFIAAVTASNNWESMGIPREAFAEHILGLKSFKFSTGFREFYRMYSARFQKSRYGDKTPLYCKEMELIRRLLPEVKFIHIIRDGRDAMLSMRKRTFAPSQDMRVLAAYWANCVKAARRDGQGREDYLEVRYEDLIRDPRPVLERICVHVDLPFSEAMLNYHENAPARLAEYTNPSVVAGESRRPLLTQPPRKERLDVWKQEMTPEDLAVFMEVAGELMYELGYE